MHLADQLDFDTIVMKLFFAIVLCATIRYAIYSDASLINLSHIKDIILNVLLYVDLSFFNVFFTMDEAVVKTHGVQWF
ncbi:unnamed protein product [Rotaria socialis]|uniref:Uncharacterized protein n=1 Tax=Rotaria socialis TaxID=392032 RepID=A0A817RPM8_9BILA|nr:unnamed protein product [Rotaria socialis]CAF3396390.1 unnamed protein product [Rotaria socialis]CAF3417839.1 unnamed protein product [Rotaria socialis]